MQLLYRNYRGSSGVWVSAEGSQVNHKKTESETPGKHIIARITMLALPRGLVLADIRSTVSRSEIIAATVSSSFVVATGNRANAHMRAASVSPV